MRYLLQRVLTNEWLLRDFELTDGTRTRELSAPGGITGFVDPEWRNRLAPDGKPYLMEWGTIIYAEQDGRISNAGIIERLNYERDRLQVEAPGFARYPNGTPYEDKTNFGRTDPLAVVRHLWAHIQSWPNSNLGVTVDPTTTPSTSWIGDNANPYGLLWWENRDCGAEIDSLAQQTPFDYIEQHSYLNAAQTSVKHHIRIGYPRLGRRRNDLRFAEGENLISTIPVDVSGEAFANSLIGIGRGEGSKMVYGKASIVDGRLRRTKILTDKTAQPDRLRLLLQTELAKRLNVPDVSQITIQDHPNAPLSALDPGDDILLQASLPWLGTFRLWVRVLSITETDSSPGTAVLATQRSDSFIYSNTVEIA